MNRREFLIGASVATAAATTSVVLVRLLQQQTDTGGHLAGAAVQRQLVHAADYAALRETPASTGDLALVAAAGPDGAAFTATETALRDNGGTVIGAATPGVMWVRDGTYNTASAPMHLSWFEQSFNGALVAEDSDISQVLARIVEAAIPEPSAPPLPATSSTVGMWVFADTLGEYGEQPFNPTALYLEAPFPVRLSTLHLPWGHVELDISGPVAFTTGLILGTATEVDQYVPRAKLFGFDRGRFRIRVDHDGLDSVEHLLTAENDKKALELRVATRADGTTLRIADGLEVDRILVSKSGISPNPLRIVVRPQSDLPITFTPDSPWTKVLLAEDRPNEDPGALVFDSLLSRYVFEVEMPGEAAMAHAARPAVSDGKGQRAARSVEPDRADRLLFFDNWDTAAAGFLSFWYRATDGVALALDVIPEDDTTQALPVAWAAVANDNWQEANLDVAAVLAGKGYGTKVRAVRFRAEATTQGYYRLAGWRD
ncbi:MAG: hypothetical protein EA406_00125 [Rhodospirillales bacterium]|nr:MAG: hypothetical protein EA406_00125 [Rhodospirillales bacterium]